MLSCQRLSSPPSVSLSSTTTLWWHTHEVGGHRSVPGPVLRVSPRTLALTLDARLNLLGSVGGGVGCEGEAQLPWRMELLLCTCCHNSSHGKQASLASTTLVDTKVHSGYDLLKVTQGEKNLGIWNSLALT